MWVVSDARRCRTPALTSTRIASPPSPSPCPRSGAELLQCLGELCAVRGFQGERLRPRARRVRPAPVLRDQDRHARAPLARVTPLKLPLAVRRRASGAVLPRRLPILNLNFSVPCYVCWFTLIRRRARRPQAGLFKVRETETLVGCVYIFCICANASLSYSLPVPVSVLRLVRARASHCSGSGPLARRPAAGAGAARRRCQHLQCGGAGGRTRSRRARARPPRAGPGLPVAPPPTARARAGRGCRFPARRRRWAGGCGPSSAGHGVSS